MLQNAKRWLEYMTQAMEEPGQRPLSMDQIQDMVREKVTENYQGFSRAFADVDYARIGVVSKDDFRGVLNKLALRLDDDQVRLFFLGSPSYLLSNILMLSSFYT